ncbi:GH36-type glycosyl hydrolase domain-containing protein [Paenibacillus rhizoplanae]
MSCRIRMRSVCSTPGIRTSHSGTSSFSRNISYYATGTFRGVGYRDTAQDILAVVPYDPEAAKDKVRLLLGQQYQDGHVNHYFFPE